MADLIALVDLDDRIIGYETKEEVHRKGLLHRAFSVFIVDEGKMLIQMRNPDKYHSGGLWSNACCSHQRKASGSTAAMSGWIRRKHLRSGGSLWENSKSS